MNKTKEEIIADTIMMDPNVGKSLVASRRSIAEAMQTYADQETAELKEQIAQLRSRLEECKRQKLTGSRI